MEIITTGLSARFVDLGRLGHQHKGFTQSGAIDLFSHKLANAILGKAFEAATIEVLLGGFFAIATQDITIAVTGAETVLLVNGMPKALNTAVLVRKGQKLQLEPPSIGARNYIACGTAFAATYFLASCCAVLREKTGGLNSDGLGLKNRDVIRYLKSSHVTDTPIKAIPNKEMLNTEIPNSEMPAKRIPKTLISPSYTLRVVLGYQHDLFDHKQKALFFNQSYRVGADTNSMGMRLDGISMGHQSVKMYSEGIANGAVQITPNGLPIIMLSERQTIGGYPKMGSIISNDLPELGQCLPGSLIQFQECDMFTARQLWLMRQQRLTNFAKAQFNTEY